MGLLTWILLGIIVLVAIGLGVGVFFGGLLRGAEIVGQNPAVQNASEEARQFIDDKAGSIAGNPDISVTTDRAEYDVGDPVRITVKNNGGSAQEFPNAALGLKIQNSETGREYTVVAAQVITDLGQGESKEITWQDASAPAGSYTATVYTSQGGSASASFEIRE